ncbi:MAG: hypothetical protein ONA90_04435 [candidate division KSB1 bacterium]|nr:hypothetical protein [candidate division KSB1 bacterium]
MLRFITMLISLLPFVASAADQVVIIAGKGGQPQFTQKYAQYARSMYDVLITKHGFTPQQITVLAEREASLPFANAACSAEQVRAAFARLTNTVQTGDLVIVILFGHGSFDGNWAKFNLEGPDLRDLDFAQLLDGLPAQRQVFINTTATSGPFIEKLSRPNRLVITATRSGAEHYTTMFPEYFVEAFLKPEEADLDKNGQVSLLEAFDYSRDRMVRFYESANRLRPEHPLLDDDGDGIGSETPSAIGGDGQLAARTYFLAHTTPTPRTTLDADHPLEKEKRRLLAEIETLKARKNAMPEGDYNRKIEELFIRLAKLNRRIKSEAK